MLSERLVDVPDRGCLSVPKNFQDLELLPSGERNAGSGVCHPGTVVVVSGKIKSSQHSGLGLLSSVGVLTQGADFEIDDTTLNIVPKPKPAGSYPVLPIAGGPALELLNGMAATPVVWISLKNGDRFGVVAWQFGMHFDQLLKNAFKVSGNPIGKAGVMPSDAVEFFSFTGSLSGDEPHSE